MLICVIFALYFCYNPGMNIKALSYFTKFRCIADKCRHSCCLGWEIDIDPESFKRYQDLKGDYGKILRSNIEEDPSPHFMLDAEERCPFHNEKGLCDMILNIGEDMLCNICKDHPRYRNRDEIGLGICCEEALRLLLDEEGPITLISVGDDPDISEDSEMIAPYIEIRNSLIDVLNRDIPFDEKIDECTDIVGYGLKFDPDESLKILSGLEKMDPAWDDKLKLLGQFDFDLSEKDSHAFSNLLIYFIHRYLPQSYNDYSFVRLWLFCEFSVFCIMSIRQNGKKDRAFLEETARLYSSEIEYSDENIDIILDLLSPDIP